ncbi:MAG: hypothetical protein M3512_12855 [Bacteroidota bacterium]|nr:hypothetical protein [Bacteroidota bacterium]
MKTKNFFNQVPGLLLISGALVFSSCDNNARNDRNTVGTDNRDNLETTDDRAVDTYEISEADYTSRRDRVTTNLDGEINRTKTEVEDLRQRSNTVTAEEEKNELQAQIDRMEARIENLENQQGQLENSNKGNWEETERNIENSLSDTEGSFQGDYEGRGTGVGTGAETGVGTGTESIMENQSDTRTNSPNTGTETEINNSGAATDANRTETTDQTGNSETNAVTEK